MKKKIASLFVMAMITFTTIYALPIKENISRKVQSAFSQKFADASNIHWSNNEKYIKASFQSGGAFMFAYFNPEGDYIGVTRNVQSNQLPINLQSQLKMELSESWISELVEFASDDETSYFATIENAEHKILLKASGSTSWEVVKKNKKD